MTILITGANGQVGFELRRRAGSDAVALTRAELDISDATAVNRVIAELRPDVVINAAAYTAVDKAEQEPQAAFAINRDGPAHLAAACAEHGSALLHLSTDYVFDGHKPSPYFVTDPVSPAGVYGRSKAEGEQRVREQLPRHLILRVSWVFGAHGHNFVKTMLRLGRERSELRVVADQHGGPTPASAIAETLLALAQRIGNGEHLPWGTYHYCGAPATTWHGFASTIFERAHAFGLIAKQPLVHPISSAEYPLPAPRPLNSRLDSSLAHEQLGLAQPDWRPALDAVLHSIKEISA